MGYKGDAAVLLQTDADHDGNPEILLLGRSREDQCYVHRYDSNQQRFNYLGYRDCGTDPAAALRQHGIRYQRPRYDDLLIGEQRLNLNTTN